MPESAAPPAAPPPPASPPAQAWSPVPTPQPIAGLQRLCRSDQLVEKGRALLFDVIQYREPMRAFALRYEGRAVAYLNRCAHVPTEMDWQPGEFLDSDKAFILCSIHGAAYEPLTGRCASGPCGRGTLQTIELAERDGEICWQPTRDITPAAVD